MKYTTTAILRLGVALLSACVAIAQEQAPNWGELNPAPTEPTTDGVLSFRDAGETQLADKGIKRRDPSDIIRVAGVYHIWYTKTQKGDPGHPNGWAGTVWHATSKDGHHWIEEGRAIDKSKNAEDWDSHGVYTPNITTFKEKYYLGFTAMSALETKHQNRQASIGIAVADSPSGPWKKVKHNPVIPVGESLADADSFLCDDTVFIVRNGKLHLYYKGWAKMLDENGKPVRFKAPKGTQGKKGGSTFLMGAASANPEIDPFVKYAEGPLHRAHEMVLWPEKDGSIGSLCMGWGEMLYYRAADGKTFIPLTTLDGRQGAAGLFRTDLSEDWNGERPAWGMKMSGGGLKRFEPIWPEE